MQASAFSCDSEGTLRFEAFPARSSARQGSWVQGSVLQPQSGRTETGAFAAGVEATIPEGLI